MSSFFRNFIRLISVLMAGFFLYTFGLPHLLGDPDLRVNKGHSRHELCLKASERREFRKPVSPGMENVIKGTSKDFDGVLDHERTNYLAQMNKNYSDCLADFDSLPKKCFDDFNSEYVAKGFDPEKYADFRKDVVKKCVAKGEIEVECKQVYSGRDIEYCIQKKTKTPDWEPFR